MQVEILEVAGLIPAMQALRLPYSREPRSWAEKYEDRVIDNEYSFDVRNTTLFHIHKNDLALANKLIKGGDEHAKVLRGVVAYLKVTATRGWWQEMNTYRIGCECLSSTSTMHTITKGVNADMFDCDMHEAQEYYDVLQPLIEQYNKYDKELREHSDAHDFSTIENIKDEREMLFRSIKRHIPECFLQTRILAVSYQTLRRIWIQRRNHRLVEWKRFCEATKCLPFAEQLIFVEK